jgi:8-oxo-dGTP diphosphatase
MAAQRDGSEPAGIHAAGALLWRPGSTGTDIVLVHRPRYDDWSFPKGKRDRGEHILLTAVREVEEEAGIRPVLGRRLSSVAYLADGRRKQVHYWAARPAASAAGDRAAVDGQPQRPGRFVPTDEVDAAPWLPAGGARARLSYAHDAAVLDEFLAGPASTFPVILLRHAAAVSKRAWAATGHAEDLARPLSPRGRTQAGKLGLILNCYPPARVISSAAERCLATVEPYAEQAGVAVEAEPAFTLEPGAPRWRGSGWVATPAARRRVDQAVTAGHPVIICGHRQNMLSLLAWACDRLGAPVPPGPPLEKGSFWVLHASAGRLVSAERHDVVWTVSRATVPPLSPQDPSPASPAVTPRR